MLRRVELYLTTRTTNGQCAGNLPWPRRSHQQFCDADCPILIDALARQSYIAGRRSFRSALHAPVIG
jgi:hypothetical protein